MTHQWRGLIEEYRDLIDLLRLHRAYLVEAVVQEASASGNLNLLAPPLPTFMPETG